MRSAVVFLFGLFFCVSFSKIVGGSDLLRVVTETMVIMSRVR